MERHDLSRLWEVGHAWVKPHTCAMERQAKNNCEY